MDFRDSKGGIFFDVIRQTSVYPIEENRSRNGIMWPIIIIRPFQMASHFQIPSRILNEGLLPLTSLSLVYCSKPVITCHRKVQLRTVRGR